MRWRDVDNDRGLRIGGYWLEWPKDMTLWWLTEREVALLCAALERQAHGPLPLSPDYVRSRSDLQMHREHR